MNIPAWKFNPWVGKHYSRGYVDGTRLLILGHSHYGDLPERTWTQRFTYEYMQGQWTHSFWTKIMQAVIGRPYLTITPTLREVFWQSVALYNYIQVALEGPRQRPPAGVWLYSRPAFEAVLEALQPHALLILGAETWDNLPAAIPGSGHTDCKGPAMGAGELRGHTWLYVLPGGHQVLAAGTCHPSSWRFDWASVHRVVYALLRHAAP